MFYQIKNINEEIKIMKWNQTEILALKTTKTGMKNSIEGLNCRIEYGGTYILPLRNGEEL